MGIHGLFKHLGSGERTSLAALSTQHYVQHGRPLRLAIDIAIWLFQIQAGQGGTNPALRTFYYRLLRLLSMNIHPLFVFDGPKKPLFKRNKRVGGPGVKVVSVPEFLAKQLLKQFGFPMHIAPGEAEAECALLQREGVVDAVLSEDVDTMMFGSTLTLRSWTAEGTSKTPTHVNVYDQTKIEASSGLDCHGMILVALMSGGDYIPEGIPGCGPKLAVDAARAGYGKRLCALEKRDSTGLAAWREELQMELRTNVSKFFTRRNTTLTVPDDFPNFEVFKYYTHPIVSSSDQVEELRKTLTWDSVMDLPALRSFAGDAFDWVDRGGAIKFIRNLAPALLLRNLRLAAEHDFISDLDQRQHESTMLEAVHGKRTHASTDGKLEIRVSYIPAKLVPIDLSIEPIGDDDDLLLEDDDDEASLNAHEVDNEIPPSSSLSRRAYRPYEESAAEKLWILREWIQLGCPAMLENYEASLLAPPKSKTRKPAVRSKARSVVPAEVPNNALTRHLKISKPRSSSNDDEIVPMDLQKTTVLDETIKQMDPAPTRRTQFRPPPDVQAPTTPSRRKRRTADLSTPRSGKAAITHFFSPSASRGRTGTHEIISLLSSSPTGPASPIARSDTYTRPHKTMKPSQTIDGGNVLQAMSNNVASNTAKFRAPRSRTGLQKSLSIPMAVSTTILHDTIECLDLAESPMQSRIFTTQLNVVEGGAVVSDIDHQPTMLAGLADTAAIMVVDLSGCAGSARQLAASTTLSSESVVPQQLEQESMSSVASACKGDPTSGMIRPIKKFIKIRESLDGAWTTSTASKADTLDLTGVESSAPTPLNTKAKTNGGRKNKIWRESGVDILDLTKE